MHNNKIEVQTLIFATTIIDIYLPVPNSYPNNMEKNSVCSICTQNVTKYRCPKCDIKYCTHVCFKTHKTTCEDKETARLTSQNTHQEISLPSIVRDDASTSRSLSILSASQKEKLRNSKQIQNILKSKRLRDHIQDIDSASDRQKSLRNLRSKNKEFDSFLKDLLVTIKED